jgi:flagellar biosynthesis/type III secretory pathway chaperone
MSDHDSGRDGAGLGQILDRGIELMHGLKAALLDEREALAQRDAERLQEAAGRKDQLARQLLVVDSHKSEIRALAEQAGDSGKTGFRGRWQQLQDMVRDCERLNRTNGTIIRARRQQVMDGLSVLRGRDHDEDTYTLSGTTASTIGRRTLTEA